MHKILCRLFVVLIRAVRAFLPLGAFWDFPEDQDGGAGNRGIVDKFRENDNEIFVVWKELRRRSNYCWGQIKIVGRSADIFVGDVVVRGDS